MIFLGLASNYSAGHILRHLFAWGTPSDSQALRQSLATRYGAAPDQVALYHTGRSALAAALIAVADPGAKVILPGLTCIAVVRAIKAAGCIPVYSDIDPKTLQYDFDALDKTLMMCYNGSNGSQSPAFLRPENDNNNENSNGNGETVAHPRPVILAQNTLGLPLDATKLEAIAQKHDAIIIEDLAHSAGRFYPDGRGIGTIGAAAALSFGKGKAIDTICGGALVVRQPKSQPLPQPPKRPRLSQSLRDRWYPVIAGLSRTFWNIGLGKALLAACVKLRWVERSADAELSLDTRLTHWQAREARAQLAKLPSTPLREHYFVKDRDQVLQELKSRGYDLCETWYDTPVSPVRYAFEADFPADRCPATVKVAEHIVNLPTWYSPEKIAPAREFIKSYEVEL